MMTSVRKRCFLLSTVGLPQDGDSEGDSGFVTPDSTTKEKVSRFIEGEDVLSHGKDGLFYLGVIVVVDSENERCLVQFEDSTAHWSLYKDLTKLKLPESDDLCVICKSSKSWETNEIVLCHICEQGYHQDCLQPRIGQEFCEPDSQWECPQCAGHSAMEKEERKKSRENSPRKQRPRPQPQNQTEENNKLVLPYEINSLTWDQGHKSNREQTYCYCGGPGEWYNRMLQCQRCKQWFHEACVDCLHHPLLYGDRFYVFVCALCNEGTEFLHRLDVKWVDVVHLSIFNLTLQDSKTYFEYEDTITQWINDNWDQLQAPLGLQKVGVSERKHEVLRVLEGNRPRFKCGREIKKKTSIWGLRVRVPPPVPAITLPYVGPITEDSIKHITLRNKKTRNADSPPIPRSYKLREDKQEEMEEAMARFSPAKKRAVSPSPLEQDEESPGSSGKRKRKRELDILMEDKKAKKMIEEVGSVKANSTTDSQAPVKRKRGRPPKNQPSLISEDLRDLKQKRAQKLLKEALKQGNNMHPVSKSGLDVTTPTCLTPGDTSGDETSSHGTLDSFIPPPSNFEGQNNPFLNLDSLSYGMPVVRPLKRKLNESDIRIGKNGEVKRRKVRKKGEKGKLVSLLQQHHASMGLNGANGIRLNGTNSIKNCVDYALSGRLTTGTKDVCSESGEEPKVADSGFSLSDLKSTVNNYFGAANRIANGEKFHVIARRVSFEEKVQYLIEWDCPSSS